MPTTKKRMCWREVEFPQTGYLTAPITHHPSRNKNYPIPLMRFVTSLDEIMENFQHLKTESSAKEIIVTGNVMVLPLTFEKNYPHKPEHWGKPGPIQPDIIDRISIFLDVFNQPEFYHVLVTPDGKDRHGQEFFTVDMPFKLTTSDTDIDQYIKNSNLPVDETARYSAFYLPGQVFTINVQNKNQFKGN